MSGHLAATWRAHLTPRIGQRRHTHIYIHSFTKKECIDRYVYIYVYCVKLEPKWRQDAGTWGNAPELFFLLSWRADEKSKYPEEQAKKI